jgi:hypothetical protein
VKILPLLLAGGAAAIAADYAGLIDLGLFPSAGEDGAGAEPSGPTTPNTNPVPNNAPAQQTQSLAEAVKQKAVASGYRDNLATFDEWNYFYQLLRGVPGPAIEDAFPAGLDRSYRMTVDEWFGAVSGRDLLTTLGVL